MLFGDHPVVVRGGGDLGSGVVYQLHRAGFPVVVLEIEHPLAIRRAVSFASAVSNGEVLIEGIAGVRVDSFDQALLVAGGGLVPVVVSPDLPQSIDPADVIVDARIAKRNIDTAMDEASLVVGLGPGFTAGVDCHCVVETQRGHRLGRVIWDGTAEVDSGVPGLVGSAAAERVIHAPIGGEVTWEVSIGDQVTVGEKIGAVGRRVIVAAVTGVVRGLIEEGFAASEGLKIADIDPRGDRAACFSVSDKARLVGAGVLEAVLTWRNRLEE
jgi:xanthine dehydrogenase accessory factor